MFFYLLSAFSSVFILSSFGADVEDCMKGVLNRKETYNVASGESLSLSCIVEHCGDTYTWTWIWQNSSETSLRSVSMTETHSVTNETLSVDKTRLVLDLEKVSELEEGDYGCKVVWSSGGVSQGHLMSVNVTAGDIDGTFLSSERKVLHRVLVCSGAALCVAAVLGLALCLRSKVRSGSLHRKSTPSPSPSPSAEHQVPLHQSTPRPPPRQHPPQEHRAPKSRAPQQPRQKTEMVYAAISQDALQQRQKVTQSEEPPTVYSSLRFDR